MCVHSVCLPWIVKCVCVCWNWCDAFLDGQGLFWEANYIQHAFWKHKSKHFHFEMSQFVKKGSLEWTCRLKIVKTITESCVEFIYVYCVSSSHMWLTAFHSLYTSHPLTVSYVWERKVWHFYPFLCLKKCLIHLHKTEFNGIYCSLLDKLFTSLAFFVCSVVSAYFFHLSSKRSEVAFGKPEIR